MKVSVICAADRPERLPLLAWSLVAQTHTEWELLVLDQSVHGDVDRYFGEWLATDVRIVFANVPRHGDWGYREKARAAGDMATGEALMFPQDDSYYTPTALASMSARIEGGADLVLCGWLYDQFGYAPMPPTPRVGHVDIGGFLVRRDVFLARGWPEPIGQTTDGLFVEALIAAGAKTVGVQGVHYVRN